MEAKMSSRVFRLGAGALVALFVLVSSASADTFGYFVQGGVLPDAPAYDWYYGCSPTSAGMMMGYYDIHGYSGLSYGNLVRGGTAELSTWSPAGSPLADKTIASDGYIKDFYSSDFGDRGASKYGVSGDDIATSRSPDSLADFMGTSQDAAGNPNGSTTFYYWTNGAPFTAQDAANYGVGSRDGMYGLWEYVNYAGYADPMTNFYTQCIYGPSTPAGFTFSDYEKVIDAGGVVMIQVAGHSMFGYGYGPGNSVYVNDTWSPGVHTMQWGGSYANLSQWGVTVFTPASVPEPGSVILLLTVGGLLARALMRTRSRA
jgi:hypothetical protein